MIYKLFLDDDADTTRRPEISVENDGWRQKAALPAMRPKGHDIASPWHIAKSYDEATALVLTLGFPTFVSFDHDLGDSRSGKAVAWFLIELDMDAHTMPENFSWEVHSMNPIGRTDIDLLLSGYITHRAR